MIHKYFRYIFIIYSIITLFLFLSFDFPFSLIEIILIIPTIPDQIDFSFDDLQLLTHLFMTIHSSYKYYDEL